MTQQFTASEVRDSAIAVVARDMEYEAEMLRAFADLLEAQEIARNDAIEREYERENNPAPSDAERLAEALHDCIRDLRIAAEYGKTMRNPKALLETVERAEKVLAAQENPNG